MYGEKLKQIRKTLGFSQKHFAVEMGLSIMALSRLETNESLLKVDHIAKLRQMGVNLDWLLTGSGEMFLSGDDHCTGAVVPIIDARAAAGAGVVNDPELIIGTSNIGLEFREYWGKDTCILRIYGDSMEPTIPKNAWVLVHKTPALRSEGIFVFLHDNELRCKRIQKMSSGEVVVKSDNNAYDPEVYPKGSEQLGELILLGEVVGVIQKF